MTQSEKHIDEIKNLRDEINWRVKIAYTSNVIFIGVISLLSNFISEPNFDKLDDVKISFIGLIIVILISMYSSILNGNHLIEKRIELYILQIQKKLYELDEYPHHFWISYLYGYRFNNSKLMRILSVVSSTTVGLFQYALPILFSVFILFYINIKYHAFVNYSLLFIFATLTFIISFFSALFFLFFVSKVSKEHSSFFNKTVIPYLNKSKKDENTNK